MDRRQLLKSLAASATLAAAPKSSLYAQAAPLAPALHLNQVGYLPAQPKCATLANAAATDRAFRIRSTQTNAVALEGTLTAPVADPTSGDRTQQAIFSTLKTPGSYRLEAAGLTSDVFLIQPAVYQPAFRLTMRSYFGQRCGCAVDLGGGYKHARCHDAGAFHATTGKAGALRNTGGWHDAGDYGRYIVNSGISTATLLYAWELFPEAASRLQLNIPESGGKLPDLLAEIRWNLDWMLSLQDTDGGVWHKQTSENFCAFILPEDDHLTSFVIGTGTAPYKSTAATADLAAVAAIAARCYAPFDPAYANSCLTAARRAYAWAAANPKVIFTNPPGILTGEYGDGNPADELLWAAAELWRATGEAEYEQRFLTAIPQDLKIPAPSWGYVAPLAYWTYALAERPGSPAVKNRIRDATLDAARTLAANAAESGYGHTLAMRDFGWGSNSVAGNQAMLLLIAGRFAPSPGFTEAALNNLHYLLGRNCHGVSWVTGLGARPFQHPHHRPSAADNIVAPWPGLLSAGPNARPADPDAKRLLTPAAPMRMWVDHQGAYSVNEVAINWNAPLVFLLAGANTLA